MNQRLSLNHKLRNARGLTMSCARKSNKNAAPSELLDTLNTLAICLNTARTLLRMIHPTSSRLISRASEAMEWGVSSIERGRGKNETMRARR